MPARITEVIVIFLHVYAIIVIIVPYTSCSNTYPFFVAISLHNIRTSIPKNVEAVNVKQPVKGTMKKPMRQIALCILLAMSSSRHLASCTKTFSEAEFNSAKSKRDLNNFSLMDFVNLNKVNDEATESQQVSTSLVNKLNNYANGFVETRNLRKRSYSMDDDSTKQPIVINNIQIVVSENRTKSGMNTCKNGICNISVSSKLNNEGDIVTDVHFNVITKLETDFETHDIPIVDGIRGVKNTYNRSSDIHSLSHSRSLAYLYSIPQIQSRYQAEEPWYQGQRTVQRPQIKFTVDDKIEPPFSKTQSNKE